MWIDALRAPHQHTTLKLAKLTIFQHHLGKSYCRDQCPVEKSQGRLLIEVRVWLHARTIFVRVQQVAHVRCSRYERVDSSLGMATPE